MTDGPGTERDGTNESMSHVVLFLFLQEPTAGQSDSSVVVAWIWDSIHVLRRDVVGLKIDAERRDFFRWRSSGQQRRLF